MIPKINPIDKAAEYQQGQWRTCRHSETKIAAVNNRTGATLTFIVAFGRIFGCVSGQSGEYYDMPGGGCPCPDNDRAMKLGRPCRHAAAWDQVDRHLEAERQAAEFRSGNEAKYDQRVEQLAREIEAEMHHYPGEEVAA